MVRISDVPLSGKQHVHLGSIEILYYGLFLKQLQKLGSVELGFRALGLHN